MRFRVPQIRVNIASRLKYQSDDGFLQSVEVLLGEQERASSCAISVFDPELKLLNLLLTEFQKLGGIIVPKDLLGEEKKDEGAAPSGTPVALSGDPGGYLKMLEQKYGTSDLTGLTPLGRKAYASLSIGNVRWFLNAVAIAELGEASAAKGGYGYLFGDMNTESFDPRTLTTHPKKRRTMSGFTSNATGRYQTMDFVWDDDTQYGSKGLGLKDFKPISQEILAVGRLMYRGVLEQVQRGEIEAALEGNGKRGNGASWEWASLEPKRYSGQGTPGGKKSTFIANFNRFKASASSSAPASTAKSASAPTPTSTSTPTTTTTSSANNLPSASTELNKLKDPAKKDSTTAIDSTQGTRLFIELGFNDTELTIYEFLLTDVQGSDSLPHTTRIQGRQIRAIAAKSPKSFGVFRNTTIRQLANQIAASVGASVEILDDLDADKVMTVTKKNETDYQALVKAVKTIGLFVRGDASKIKLEGLKTNDKTRLIKKDALLPGSTWGDSASNDRSITVPTPTTAPTPTPTPTATNTNNALPSASADLAKLKAPVNLNKSGILDIKSAADEKKGIGKGFEGQLQLLTVLQPDCLTWQPGEIVKPDTGYGGAIDREYRISQVRHAWTNGAISSTVSIYLPVAVVVKQDSSPEGGAVAPVQATGNTEFDKWDAKWKKAAARGDVIAGTGRRVTSPFGMRKHPVTGVLKMHWGTDVDCATGTKIYGICKPGETVDVEYLPNQGGAGNMIRYQTGEYTIQVFHLDSGRSGKYQAGQIIAYSGSTGIGTGAHKHAEIYKTKEGLSKRFAIPLGYLYWMLTGNAPG